MVMFTVMHALCMHTIEDGSDGEQVIVTGSRVPPYDDGRHHGGGQGGGQGGGGMMGGGGEHDYVIVTVLEADGVVLPLRDDEGYPFWRGGDDWMGHSWFDPATITTLTGTLHELLGMWSAWGHGNHTGNEMHYTFASDGGESFYAILGPAWLHRKQGCDAAGGRPGGTDWLHRRFLLVAVR